LLHKKNTNILKSVVHLNEIMLRLNCSTELPSDEGCDATGDAQSVTGDYIKMFLNEMFE